MFSSHSFSPLSALLRSLIFHFTRLFLSLHSMTETGKLLLVLGSTRDHERHNRKSRVGCARRHHVLHWPTLFSLFAPYSFTSSLWVPVNESLNPNISPSHSKSQYVSLTSFCLLLDNGDAWDSDWSDCSRSWFCFRACSVWSSFLSCRLLPWSVQPAIFVQCELACMSRLQGICWGILFLIIFSSSLHRADRESRVSAAETEEILIALGEKSFFCLFNCRTQPIQMHVQLDRRRRLSAD